MSSEAKLVQQLADRLRAGLGPGVLERLAQQPLDSISSDLALEVEFREEARTHDGCGVDGAYVAGSSRIVVARSASTRRRNFTALHEAAHHLCFTDIAISDELSLHPNVSLEEAVANTFAADVLVPHAVTDEVIGLEGLTAAAVRRLYDRTEASRSACCAAAVRYLPSKGYVLLAETSGEVFFAAATPQQYVVAPGSPQPETSVLARAGQNGRARDVDRLMYRTGNKTGQHNIDAVRDDDGWVFAVAVAGAAWGMSAMLDDRPAARGSVECPNCELEIQTWGRPCPDCGDYRCPRCKQCACRTRPDDARCPSCSMLVLPHLLIDGGCRNCM